jgi:hypothetical protein
MKSCDGGNGFTSVQTKKILALLDAIYLKMEGVT